MRVKRTPLRRRVPLPRSTIRGSRNPNAQRKRSSATPQRPDPDWPAARTVALERDEYTCQMCGHQATDVHHRIGRGMGGSTHPDRHRPDRLVSLCRQCHDWIGGTRNRQAAETDGWVVRRGGNAETVPVRTFKGLVLLTRDARVVTVEQAA